MQAQLINRAPFPPPLCPDCQTPMYHRTTVPDKKYFMLLRVMFVCDCGRLCDQLVAKSMLAILPMQVL